jgi:hypothetical protein
MKMKQFKIRSIKINALAAAVLSIFAGSAAAEGLVALSGNNQIGVFDSGTSLINTSLFKSITGTNAGEVFVGIDLRPSDNLIYGLTTSNNIYTINAYTGVSSYVATLSQPIIDATNKSYGFDFNPVADRSTNPSLRLVSSTGDNYGINVTTGAVSVATSIASGYTSVAYRNSDASTPNEAPASTQLYYVNAGSDTLDFAATGFNNPTITTVGALGNDVFNTGGFEITNNDNAYGAFSYASNPANFGLFSVDLATGNALQIASFTNEVNGLTSAPVSPVPEPETYGLMLSGLGMIGFMLRRRKS